ncbi:MAG: EAL domain-containing protein [Roseibium sp.]|uniref:EAL domain-containing protein n=1 Tax=Roseibium sp. TaxID=1936156 RepID=UPI003D9C0E99
MQISHRLAADRRDHSGPTQSNILSAFHTSLLEVLPFAAAYVARDGAILACNKTFENSLQKRGLVSVPDRFQAFLSGESCARFERVLEAAFGGLPAEVSGEMHVRSGDVFCSHFMCTSHVFLQKGCEAVLVQFETESGIAERWPMAADVPGRTAPASAGTHVQRVSDSRVLAHFPDEILFFDGRESHEDMALTLLEKTDGAQDLEGLMRTLEVARQSLPQTLHIPEAAPFTQDAAQGGARVCEVRLVALPGDFEGNVSRNACMAIVRRNVENPAEIAENKRLAYEDPLTGLENRRAFTRALKRELEHIRDDGDAGLAVYYIDLDEFKKVNDLGGHDAGDDMLLQVASCLKLTLGELATVARIGGDEFAAMLPVTSRETAHEYAEKVLEGFARIRLEIKDRVFTISGSVGVAYCDAAMRRKNTDANALLGLADTACLRGKRGGGRSVQLYGGEAGEDTSEPEEKSDLPEPESFCGKELVLYAMPIVSLRNNETCGHEVLLRLQGDRAKGLSSRAWISAAERSGFIAQVDAWTLDRVLDAAERNATRSLLTMNVSAESARDPGFRDSLHNRLSVNPLLASRLCLEIAEKDFLREPSTVESFFGFVSEFGCQTAIDDFAGHWPVLSRLPGMRVEWLKLEAGLTRQVLREPARAEILSGLIGAARNLGMKVIAKHIETPAQADLLRTLDIEAAQGFHFGRPAPWIEVPC